MLSHRQNNILTGTTPGYAEGWDVYAYPIGATIASASTGSTITVEEFHSVVAGDKGLIFKSDGSTEFTAAVSSVGTTSIVFSPETYSVVKGDLFVNLGADTGTTAANLDASTFSIWQESNPAQTAYANSKVTTDSGGNYDYYYLGTGSHWELIVDNTGVVRSVIAGFGNELPVYTSTSEPKAAARWAGKFIRVRDVAQPEILKYCVEGTTAGTYEWNDITTGSL